MHKHYIRWALAIFSISNSDLMFGFGAKTFVATRSQSVKAWQELAGWQQEINRTFSDRSYMVFSMVADYSRSSTPDRFNALLFGNKPLTFSGSFVSNRGSSDILADYFGLPGNFQSTVCFTPVITNFAFDLDWYHGLDDLYPGLFYRVHMPIVHSKWDLNMHEIIVNAGSEFNPGESVAVDGRTCTRPKAAYPAGYLSEDRLLLTNMAPSVELAWQGSTVFGDVRSPLRYGKVFGRQELTRASDLQFAFGWNFLRADWYHFGAAARIVAPVGNRSTAEFLFEPMVGNMGHWEVGFSFTGHAVLWQNNETSRAIALYGDANVTHLCASKQRRSFDLHNSAGSRYMLLTDNGSPSHNLFFANQGNRNGVMAETQYQERLVPAINETTFATMISIGVQVDMVLKAAYQRENLECDLGYGLWARSKEVGCRCGRLESGRFGIKGDAQVYGFEPRIDGSTVPVPLNVTQSNATIHGGQGDGNVMIGEKSFANTNADSAQPVFSQSAALVSLTTEDADVLGVVQQQARGSTKAIFIQDSDIDERSGLVDRSMTHKMFAQVNYAWRGYEVYTPYLGVGAMIEWAGSCVKDNNGHGQWGLWLKGGVSY